MSRRFPVGLDALHGFAQGDFGGDGVPSRPRVRGLALQKRPHEDALREPDLVLPGHPDAALLHQLHDARAFLGGERVVHQERARADAERDADLVPPPVGVAEASVQPEAQRLVERLFRLGRATRAGKRFQVLQMLVRRPLAAERGRVVDRRPRAVRPLRADQPFHVLLRDAAALRHRPYVGIGHRRHAAHLRRRTPLFASVCKDNGGEHGTNHKSTSLHRPHYIRYPL